MRRGQDGTCTYVQLPSTCCAAGSKIAVQGACTEQPAFTAAADSACSVTVIVHSIESAGTREAPPTSL